MGKASTSFGRVSDLIVLSVMADDADAVGAWIDSGGNKDLVFHGDGRTLLIQAAMSKSVNVVRLLIGRKVDTTLQCNRGRTALHYAAENGSVEMVRMIADRMISSYAPYATMWRDDEDKSAIDIVIDREHDAVLDVFAALPVLDYETCRRIHEASDFYASTKSAGIKKMVGRFQLCDAIEKSNIRDLESKLKEGVKPDFWYNGRTLLEKAMTFDDDMLNAINRDMTGILLKHGADPNFNLYGSDPPVFLAISKDNESLFAKLMLAGADPECVASQGLSLQDTIASMRGQRKESMQKIWEEAMHQKRIRKMEEGLRELHNPSKPLPLPARRRRS